MTTRDQLNMQYWQTAEPSVKSISDNIFRDYLLGKKITDCKKLSLLHDLQFYLDIIQQQRETDMGNGLFNGIDYYKTLFCIPKIKKQLRCIGIEGKIFDELFNVYSQDVLFGEGIGSMIIEGVVNPFHIRSADQITQGYTTYTVPSSITNQYITYIINQQAASNYDIIVIRKNIYQDTIFPNLLPANCMFLYVIFENQLNLTAQLSMGITAGGVECFGSWAMNPLEPVTKGMTTVVVEKEFSPTVPTTLYLHHAAGGDFWGGAVFNLTFVFKKL